MSWSFVLLKLPLSGIAFILECIMNLQFGKAQSGSDRREGVGGGMGVGGRRYVVIHELIV